MNPKIDAYLSNGCGRCELGGTPRCKVHRWTEELELLRQIMLDSGLNEELKWSVPCYTFQKKNIAIVAAFKEYASLSFFKGSLLKDPEGILQKPGENTQAGRLIKFTGAGEISKLEPVLKAYIQEAIELERSGKKIEYKKASEYPVPDEFKQKLDKVAGLKEAFYSLTPGRQREYLIFFAQAKQSATRLSRVEKNLDKIFNGKGLNDHYSC